MSDGLDLELIKGLGMAKYRGAERAREEMSKRGLMEEQLRQAPLKTKTMEQEVQLGQMAIGEKTRFRQFEEEVKNEWQANPDSDVYGIIDKVARKHGLPGQLIEAYKQQNQLTEMATKTMLSIHDVYGPEKAKEFAAKDPILKDLGEPNIETNRQGDKIVTINVPGQPGTPPTPMAFIMSADKKLKPLTMPGQGKTVNMPPWYDAMGVEKIGDRYHTPEGQGEFANWYADPKNKKEVSEIRTRIIRETATPFYQVVPTEKGLETFASREGKFVGPAAGEQVRKKPLTPELIDFEGKMGVLEDSVNRVMENYDPSYVGFVAGRVGGVREMTTGLKKEQAQFYSSLARIKANMVYLLSGKQINETEYTRLLEQLPRRELPPDVFMARMEDFQKTMRALVESRMKAGEAYAMPERGTGGKPPLSSFRR